MQKKKRLFALVDCSFWTGGLAPEAGGKLPGQDSASWRTKSGKDPQVLCPQRPSGVRVGLRSQQAASLSFLQNQPRTIFLAFTWQTIGGLVTLSVCACYPMILPIPTSGPGAEYTSMMVTGPAGVEASPRLQALGFSPTPLYSHPTILLADWLSVLPPGRGADLRRFIAWSRQS